LDGGSARQKAATYTQNKGTQTAMPRVGFEPTIPVLERARTVHALDSAAAVYRLYYRYYELIKILIRISEHYECIKMYTLFDIYFRHPVGSGYETCKSKLKYGNTAL
jgi:hypothetical protein